MDNRHKILDIGCGHVKVPGAVGLDNVDLANVDVVHDILDFPYPFDERYFDAIYLKHVIEHFSIMKIDEILLECHRILKNNGKLYINVPHAFSIAAFTDPTHKTFFTFTSGYFWDKDNSKEYYKEINFLWSLVSIRCSLTWFDSKRFQLRKIDKFFSNILSWRINNALKNKNSPSLADRLVKKYNMQFCDIKWTYKKHD